MKSRISYLLILSYAFFNISPLFAKEIVNPTLEVYEENKPHRAYILEEDVKRRTLRDTQVGDNISNILPDMEFETIKIEKGRKFLVVSDSNLNNNASGIPIKFTSVQNEYLTYDKEPSTIVLHGVIEKTSKPRLAGKSATAKVKLLKITVDKITYPVVASISKMDNKNVYMGTLAGSPCYLANLSDLAEQGIIHNAAKDPCGSDKICEISTFTKPAWFIVAAALQTADLLISPFVALGKRGNDLIIPANTYFEIKLDKDLYILNI